MPAIMFVHGNLSSSVFWEDVMAAMQGDYHSVAPDLRGFGATDALPVDATSGLDDLALDLLCLADDLGFEGFHLVGHSMGGGVAMKMLMLKARSIASVTLVDPVSPFGYGGSRDVEGTPCYADGAPAGAGMVNPEFVTRLRDGDRGRSSPLSPRCVMENLYFHPPFVPDRIEALLTGMLEARIGDDWYPGDVLASENWPGSAPGYRGVLNAMSRRYFDASPIIEVDPKPPLLWVRGELDQIVADGAVLEIANLGASGQVPGWPGMDRCPPQPMVKQTRAVLEDYARRGGSFRECVVEGVGHTPFIEAPETFNRLLADFLGCVR
jgi:pimeloyl-ACP methyl ester carboxylesterase